MENFIQKVPKNIIVLIDEAYIEFTNQPSLSDLVNQHKNIIVTRTFSKLYGFAGARLGYAIAHPELLNNLELQSWSGGEISIITMAGGIAALEDTDFTNKVLKNNQLAKEFTKLN
jgi:histidinol-phosphate aminotransferase